MFAPVMKATHRALARRARRRRPRPPRSLDAVERADAAGVPGDRDRPARPPRCRTARRLRRRAASRRPPNGGARRGASRGWPRAERPLIWVGGGARGAGAEVARLAERLAAPVLTTYGAAGVLPPDAPVPRRAAAARRAARARCGTRPTSSSRSAPTSTACRPRTSRMPQPPALIAVNLDAEDAGKNYRVDSPAGGRRRGA